MFTLPGYAVNEKIYENHRISVYRGRTMPDQSPVIIKALKPEAANPSQIAKLLYEYEITRNLDLAGVIRPERLEHSDTCVALIMKDVGAVSLRRYLETNPPDLTAFFTIAVQLVGIIGEIQVKGIIHLDLKPDNILIHPGTKEVKIIDFGIVAILGAEGEVSPSPQTAAGTFEYMSPEQTDWMNTDIDYRSEFYSLGLVWYEMLTGQLPWQAESAVEWVHAHLARKPAAPNAINPEIPPVLSAIVMKLLAKTAEERYQSVFGLLWDLQECQRQWSQTAKIEFFPPGRMDVPARLQLPRKLYGRAREREALNAAFQRVCAGPAEIVLVSGYAGVGKTMLVQMSLKSLAMDHGFFVSGKSDQLRQNMPYAPLALAFGNLIRQLMTLSQEDLEVWRQRILRALGRNGTVITGVISEVELIAGPQPPIEALPPREAQSRFFTVFQRFVKVFAKKEHPLVVFLDDLQWADPATLQLIRYLTQDSDSRYLLLIGAFRDNEISHPFLALEELGTGEVLVRHITLAPLDRTSVQELIADALNRRPEELAALAGELYRKSAGNPLFLGQLFQLAYDENLLHFNGPDGCWECDLEAVRQLDLTEGVVAIILGQLRNLPDQTRQALKLAACIGNTFDLPTLSMACGKSRIETTACLRPALLGGLVLPVDDPGQPAPEQVGPDSVDRYQFFHDRVQQAIYSLLAEDEQKAAHLGLGRLLLRHAAADELNEKILSIMDHFNRSLDLIEDPAERLALAGYNLISGRKANACVAYNAALKYFKAGLELLPDNPWDACYRLSYDLHLERAQCEHLTGNIETAEQLFDILIDQTATELERADIYVLKMGLYAAVGRYSAGVQIGIDVLREFGIRLPVSPGKLDYAREWLIYKWNIRGKRVRKLLKLAEMDAETDLPEIEDPAQRKKAELIIRLACFVSQRNRELFWFLITKGANFIAKCGNTEVSSLGYICYAMTALFSDHRTAYKLGKASIWLAEKYGKSFAECTVYYVFGSMIAHWTEHGKAGLAYLHKAVSSGTQAFDTLMVGYARTRILSRKYYLGFPLQEILREARENYIHAKRIKHEFFLAQTVICQRLALALSGTPADVPVQGADDFDESGFAESLKNDKSCQMSYYRAQMQLHYFFGDYGKALSAAEQIQRIDDYIETKKGFIDSVENNFFHSLAITAIYDKLPPNKKKNYWKTLIKSRSQMKKWSDSCKENFLHKYLLIAAEMARLRKKVWKALPLYDQSIQSAHASGYLQDEALANELAARFHLAAGREKVARAYMQDALRGYQRWGAAAKAAALREGYPALLAGVPAEDEISSPEEIFDNIVRFSSSADHETNSNLEIHALRKALKNFAEETDPDKLLVIFLSTAIEGAGADKGYLILESHGELFIEAAKEGDGNDVTVIEPVPLEKSTDLALGVVRYVARTLETVVINDDGQGGIFARDPYVARSGTRSIACLPVLFQGIPVGVLYLENSLMAGVFTLDRLETLRLLSSQMAYVKRLQSFLTEGAAMSPPLLEPLTDRETEVLELIAAGMSNKEIAGKLGVSINTAKTHVKSIYGKLGVNRRVQVVSRVKELASRNTPEDNEAAR